MILDTFRKRLWSQHMLLGNIEKTINQEQLKLERYIWNEKFISEIYFLQDTIYPAFSQDEAWIFIGLVVTIPFSDAETKEPYFWSVFAFTFSFIFEDDEDYLPIFGARNKGRNCYARCARDFSIWIFL